MAGLLDAFGTSWDDPKSQAIMALASGLIQGTPQGISQGLLAASRSGVDARDRALKERYTNSQIAENESQALQRKAQAQLQEQQYRAQIAKQQALGPALAMAGGKFDQMDPAALLANGYKPEEIGKLMELANAGRPKVARTIDGMGPDGRPVTYQADEFGQQVGQGIGQWKAPMMQDFGGYKGAVDPVSLGVRPVGANTPSPESMMTDARAREANANKPMTEVQSNALLFGTRMKQADQILGKLASEGTVKPTMGALSSTGIGTALSSGPQQQMQQAQTDFMTAILRKESGAAISQGEFDTARRQYFPQLGDSPEVIQQKAQNRALAIQGVLAGAPEQHRNDLQAATGNSTKMLSRAEYDSLPSGSLYTAPDGKQRIKK